MPTYAELKNNRRQFLAIARITVREFDKLLPIFREIYEARYPATRTQSGKVRQRRVGGGRKSRLATIEDKLVFILAYQNSHPNQRAQGLVFGLGQPRTNQLIQELTPILNEALTHLSYLPERGPAVSQQRESTPATPESGLHTSRMERG